MDRDHPIHTLTAEHDLILEFLGLLEEAVNTIEAKGSWVPGDRDLEEALDLVHHVATHLVETEKHHQREEEALFPALEAVGITGPTRVMTMEHADLRPKKKMLLAAVQSVTPERFQEFKAEVERLATYIITNLRAHIFKENAILYPAALDAISQLGAWEKIKEQCDAIGYCCYTPLPDASPLSAG